MKKLLAILLTGAMLTALLAACGSEKTVGKNGLLEDGKLQIGLEIGYPPMEYYDEDGKTEIGFDVELAKAIADDMGVECVLIDTAWAGIFAGVDTYKYDAIISSVSYLPERDENYTLSKPYVANAPVLIVPKDSKIADIKDLAGKSCAVQRETTADKIIKEQKEKEKLDVDLRQYDKVINAFDELETGRVDSVCTDSVVAAYYLGDKASNYKTVWQSPKKEPIVICMKKGNDVLKEKMETAIQHLKDSGKLAEISTKYFGDDEPIKIEE